MQPVFNGKNFDFNCREPQPTECKKRNHVKMSTSPQISTFEPHHIVNFHVLQSSIVFIFFLIMEKCRQLCNEKSALFSKKKSAFLLLLMIVLMKHGVQQIKCFFFLSESTNEIHMYICRNMQYTYYAYISRISM